MQVMWFLDVWGCRTEFTIIATPAFLSFCVSFLPFFVPLCFSMSFLYILFPSFLSHFNPLSKSFLNNYVVFPVFIFGFLLSISSAFP